MTGYIHVNNVNELCVLDKRREGFKLYEREFSSSYSAVSRRTQVVYILGCKKKTKDHL